MHAALARPSGGGARRPGSISTSCAACRAATKPIWSRPVQILARASLATSTRSISSPGRTSPKAGAWRTPQGDHNGAASLRVRGPAFATGQAAGAAAAMLADHRRIVPDTIRAGLRAQGALIDLEALQNAPAIA